MSKSVISPKISFYTLRGVPRRVFFFFFNLVQFYMVHRRRVWHKIREVTEVKLEAVELERLDDQALELDGWV